MNFIKLLPIFSILFVSFPPQIQAQYVNENTISNALSQDSIWYMYSHPDTDYSLFRNQIVESICNDWEPFVSMIIANTVMIKANLLIK